MSCTSTPRRYPGYACRHRLLHWLPAALPIFAALLGQAARASDIATLELRLSAGDDRQIPVLVSYPASGCDACRLIVFSHGAFAAPERYRRLSDAWAGGGYLVAAPMHVDSELNPTREKYDRAATMRTRLEDFALLSDVERLTAELAPHGLRLADDGIIAAGHSYGALIAQLAAGATLQDPGTVPAELGAARDAILGVLALSPPGPFPGSMAAENWESVEKPMLVVTGTTDVLPGFIDDWRAHLVSFEAARRAPAYALVFDAQDHYFNGAFGRPSDTLPPATREALATLNRHTLDFLRALEQRQPPSAETWEALTRQNVQARVSPLVPGSPGPEEDADGQR